MWSFNNLSFVKKAQEHLYFLRRQTREWYVQSGLLNCFYRCVIVSVLTCSITVCYTELLYLRQDSTAAGGKEGRCEVSGRICLTPSMDCLHSSHLKHPSQVKQIHEQPLLTDD